jgi:hypothetical protein
MKQLLTYDQVHKHFCEYLGYKLPNSRVTEAAICEVIELTARVETLELRLNALTSRINDLIRGGHP